MRGRGDSDRGCPSFQLHLRERRRRGMRSSAPRGREVVPRPSFILLSEIEGEKRKRKGEGKRRGESRYLAKSLRKRKRRGTPSSPPFTPRREEKKGEWGEQISVKFSSERGKKEGAAPPYYLYSILEEGGKKKKKRERGDVPPNPSRNHHLRRREELLFRPGSFI